MIFWIKVRSAQRTALRVWPASLAGIAAQIGYKRRPGRYGGKPAVLADNTLDRQFEVDAADTVWVTDITYIRAHEGWSYLAVVIDLFSRRVVGWSMQSRITTDLALQALLATVWRRKPQTKVMIHSPLGTLLCNALPGSGPRLPVYQHRVAIVPWQTQSGCQYEQARKLS